MPITRLLACLLLVLSLPIHADNLPDIPGPADVLLSPQQEADMGRAWLRSLRGQVPILADPLVQQYCEHLVWRLMRAGNLNITDLDLVVIDTPDINAFAVPGGIIGLNAGTIINAGSEDEVAAVLAHELAHVSQRHFARRYTDNSNLNRTFLLAMLASLALAASGHADAGMAGLATTQAAAIQSQLAYSRQQEAEADRIGMQILVQAGFNPHAMPDFFEKLLKSQRFNGEPPQFLMDHPVTESRIADTQGRADNLPSPPYHSSLDFLLVRARLQALYYRDGSQAETYFSNLYQKGTSLQQLAVGYGLAVALTRNHHYDQAHNLLEALSSQAPNVWWLRATLAENDMAAGNFKSASVRLQTLLQLMPGDYALSILQARAQLQNNQPGIVLGLLTPLLQQRSRDPLLWQLSAQAYGTLKDTANAHLARGEYLFLNGQGSQGLQQLRYALKDSDENFSLHSLIEARLNDMSMAEKQKF